MKWVIAMNSSMDNPGISGQGKKKRGKGIAVFIVLILIVGALASAGYMLYFQEEDNHAPVAKIEVSATTAQVNGIITFDASGSSDEDKDLLDYYWVFGDGSLVEVEKKVNHSYGSIGTYTVTLTVDDGNLKDEDSIEIIIVANENAQTGIVINEIMFDPSGEDAGNEWVELYNSGTTRNISGWTISNRDGESLVTLPDWEFPNDAYLVVHFGAGINDTDFSDGNGTYFSGGVKEVFDNYQDECALYAGEPGNDTIVDFISYSFDNDYLPGIAHGYAASAGIWEYNASFNATGDSIQEYSKIPASVEGDSIGRDADSNDSNLPKDWDIDGGKDAFQASPGSGNIDLFGIVTEELPDTTRSETKKKWTIMVYMAFDNNLEKLCFEQLLDLQKIGGDDNISIVFQVDGESVIEEAEISNEEVTHIANTKGKTFRGFLCKDHNTSVLNWEHHENKIKRTDTGSLIRCYNPPTESGCIGERNTGTAFSLYNFIRWSKKYSPSDHYALIINSHGSGWKGVCPDETSKDYLYMYELMEGLMQGNLKLDILGFDACLMAMLEVGYQIYDEADILVASEEVIRCPGWDYKDVFGELQKHSSWTPEKLADYMVESYHRRWAANRKHTLSAVNLNESFMSLFQEVSAFGEQLTIGMEDWGDEESQQRKSHGIIGDNCQMDVRICVNSAENYHDENFIDLYDFANRTGRNDDIFTQYKSKWRDIQNLINATIIREEHGPDHQKSHGISIYFPTRQTRKPFDVYPFDNPWPSRMVNTTTSLAIYAEDNTTQWGKVPYIGNPPHPYPETPDLLFRIGKWDEFLHRYYKPCADAGPDITINLTKGQKFANISFDGSGSSDADGSVDKYYWDFDDTVDDSSGNKIPTDDMDADGIDESNDDKNSDKKITYHHFYPGEYVVTLTVWDDHYLIRDADTNSTPNQHYKTDQDQCIIVVNDFIEPGTPTTTIGTPKTGNVTDNETIMVSGEATDDIGIVEFGYTHEWSDGADANSWDPGGLTEYDFEFTLELHEGQNNITVFARDADGNESTDAVTVFYEPVDDTPPVSTLVIGEPVWNGDWVTTASLINITADDGDGVGVDHIEYRIYNGGDWSDWLIYEGEFTIETEGEIHLEFYAIDLNDNQEIVINITLYIENTPPITFEDVGDPNYEEGYIVTDETPIWLNASDFGVEGDVEEIIVGVDYIHYSIWWDSDDEGTVDAMVAEDTICDDTITLYLENLGLNEIRFHAVDLLGNPEDEQYVTHEVIEE